MKLIKEFTISVIRTGEKTKRTGEFAKDVAMSVYPDIVGSGEYYNPTTYRFYSLSKGYILVSWDMNENTIDDLTTYEIQRALEVLNWNFGRGDIVKIDYVNQSVTSKLQYGECSAHYKVSGRTVYFRGHQLTVKPSQFVPYR